MTFEDLACRATLPAYAPNWFRDNVVSVEGKCIVPYKQFKAALSCRRQLSDIQLQLLYSDLIAYSKIGEIDLQVIGYLGNEDEDKYRDIKANSAVVQALLDQCQGGPGIPNLREPLRFGEHQSGGSWLPYGTKLPLMLEAAGAEKPDCEVPPARRPEPNGPVCMPLCPPGEEWRAGRENRHRLGRQAILYELLLRNVQRWRTDPRYTTNPAFATMVEVYAELAAQLKTPKLQNVEYLFPSEKWTYYYFEGFDDAVFLPDGKLGTGRPRFCLPEAKSEEETKKILDKLVKLRVAIERISQDWSKAPAATKIIEAMRRALPLFPEEVRGKILRILEDPATYAYIVLFFAAQVTPLAFLADALALALFALAFGSAAVAVIENVGSSSPLQAARRATTTSTWPPPRLPGRLPRS